MNFRKLVASVATLTLSSSLMAAVGFAPTAGAMTKAAPLAQAALTITNQSLSGVDGTVIHVTTSGGSGTGAVSFAVSGKGCAITSAGVLSATVAGGCGVIATKAADASYKVVHSTKVTFSFVGAPQAAFSISNQLVGGPVGTKFTLGTTGGSGTGKVTFAVSGANCAIKSGAVVATAAGTCTVTATKAASAGFAVATASTNFLYCAGACPNSPTYTSPVKAALVSLTGLTSSTSSLLDDSVAGKSQFINNYFNPSDRWLQGYIDSGATVAMTWHVTGSYGQALANQAVTLFDNINCSGASGSNWATASLNANAGCNAGAAGSLSGVTDASGNVTFTLKNTNTAALSSKRPSDLTSTSAYETNEKASTSWTRFVLQVGSGVYTIGSPSCSAATGGWGDACKGPGANQATDLLDLIVVQPAGYTPPQIENPTAASPDSAVMTSITGVQGSTLDNSKNADGWFIDAYFNHADRLLYNYVNAGATVTMKWHVTGSFGQALANQAVTLTDHGDGSLHGTWTGSLSGTTDANGDVTFTLVNTNTAGGTRPTDLTSVDVANNQEYNALLPYTRFVLVIGSDVIVKPSINQTTDFSDLIVVPPVGYVPPAAPTNVPTAATPDVAHTTSISGLVAGTGMNDDSANGCQWWLCGSWHAGDSWTENYVTAGSSIVETWHVVGYNGSVMANAPVTLVVHQGGPDVSFTAPGMNPDSTVSGTTDANGDVSFTLTSNDSSAGLTCPSGINAPGNGNEGSNPWTRTILIVGAASGWNGNPYWAGNARDHVTFGAATQITDNTDLIVVPAGCGVDGMSATAPVVPAGPTPTATSPTVDTPDTAALTSVSGLAAPLIDDSINGVNWFLGQWFNGQDSWFEGYVSAGSTVTEHWHLTGDHGQVLANTPVTFVLHHGGPDLNFTTPGAVNFLAQGTTDANGDVSFDVTNTDTAANAGCPANMTQVSDSTAAGSMVWGGNDPFTANEGTYGFIETTLIIGKTGSINASATDSITSSHDWGNSTEVTALVHLLVVPADCKA